MALGHAVHRGGEELGGGVRAVPGRVVRGLLQTEISREIEDPHAPLEERLGRWDALAVREREEGEQIGRAHV